MDVTTNEASSKNEDGVRASATNLSRPAAAAIAYLRVDVGPPNRDGRTTTKVTTKGGVSRVFWKRGSWHVRLEGQVTAANSLIQVETLLQDDDKKKTVLVLFVDDEGRETFARAPKFQPVVGFSKVKPNEVTVTVWERPDAETEEEARSDRRTERPLVKVRVGFVLSVLSVVG